MALNNITLTAAMRANVLSLQNTSSLFETTQNRLATGKKVNTALDNPIAYFAAKSYTDRASDLTSLKDSMNEAIQTVKAADAGITAISDLVAQAKSIANSALATSSTTERSSYASQFDTIRAQISDVAQDASYKGTNLLQNASLKVYFNEGGDKPTSPSPASRQMPAPRDLSVAAALTNWAATAAITTSITNLDGASTSLPGPSPRTCRGTWRS